jgi:ABC-2 type transport system ATP-binding protein
VIGRGRLIADTSVLDLLAAASRGRVAVRTAARSEAITVLVHEGAAVDTTDHGMLTVTGLSAERVIALLNDSELPFSEVSSYRATLEEAYLDLTRDAGEFSAASPMAAS